MEASGAMPCDDCNKYKEEIEQLQKQVKYWKGLYLKKQHKTLSLQTLDNDSKVKMYTGLPSKNVFDGLFSSFGDKVKRIRRWKGPSMNLHPKTVPFKRKVNMPLLAAKEEYFIALFRIKTMLKAEIIGDLFGKSRTTISQICVTWWKFMARELKPLLDNPSEEAHRDLYQDHSKHPSTEKFNTSLTVLKFS